MRRFLALCLVFLFASVHPGVAAGPVTIAPMAASNVAGQAHPASHANEASLLATAGHSCCPSMDAGRAAHGKAGHCSLDGGFLPPAASVLAASAHRVAPGAASDQPSGADPAVIPHPPMSV